MEDQEGTQEVHLDDHNKPAGERHVGRSSSDTLAHHRSAADEQRYIPVHICLLAPGCCLQRPIPNL